MPEQGRVFDSVHVSYLTVGQHLNLLDLAQRKLSQHTIEAIFPRLALRLHHALNFDVITLGLYDSSAETIQMNVFKAGEAERTWEWLALLAGASGRVWKNEGKIKNED